MMSNMFAKPVSSHQQMKYIYRYGKLGVTLEGRDDDIVPKVDRITCDSFLEVQYPQR